MPVRFPCPHCNQVLSVTRRKIGSQVNCPHCGNPNVVPDEETGAARMANIMMARPAPGRELISELIVYDDVDALIGDNPGATHFGPSSSAAAGANGPSTAGRSTVGQPTGGELLLISRRTLYFQGVLFVIVAAAAFSAGFFIGRGPPPVAKVEDGAPGDKDPVLLTGTVQFARSSGDMQPDDGAVIAALPEGVVLDDRIAARRIASARSRQSRCRRPQGDRADQRRLCAYRCFGPFSTRGAEARTVLLVDHLTPVQAPPRAFHPGI